ncbi:MAG: DUF1670 domain-containing protein [Kouleothrix sp.]|nr:DUF1670 domain-containing protein [Kouleothrix sp.]
MTRARLLLFDTLHICQADRTIAVTSAPMRALLGYLALNASGGRAALRDLIAYQVWPHLDGPRGRGALSSTLHRLHRLLDNQAGWLSVDLRAIRLHEVELDFDQFRRLASAPHLADWQAAIELYKGDLLNDLDYEWLRPLRDDLRERYLQLLARVCTALMDAGKLEEALSYARRWVQDDTLNEEAHGLIIRLLARLGRPAEALRQYDALVQMLQDELGAPPLDETCALAESIRAGRQARRSLSIGTLHHTSQPARKTVAIRQTEHTINDTPTISVAVTLARVGVPLGRALADHERVTVYWTSDAGAADAAIGQVAGKVALRRHRLIRLVQEAELQGARPTEQDLARTLSITVRTIQTDIAALRDLGVSIATRGYGER